MIHNSYDIMIDNKVKSTMQNHLTIMQIHRHSVYNRRKPTVAVIAAAVVVIIVTVITIGITIGIIIGITIISIMINNMQNNMHNMIIIISII